MWKWYKTAHMTKIKYIEFIEYSIAGIINILKHFN